MNKHPAAKCNPPASRPFLKWAGGKRRLLGFLMEHLPKEGRLIEPFLGAGSVFLGGNYSKSLLGDANPDLMAVWVALQTRPTEFIHRASMLFKQENLSKVAYYRLRDEYNRQTDRFERAVLFIYLNKFGFNGVYRVNKRGVMTTPSGKLEIVPRFPLEELEQASMKLESAVLHAGSYRFLLEEAGKGDVVYCDPPYSDVGKPSFTAYTSCGFGHDQHLELCELALSAVGRGAVVAISNHDLPGTRELYAGWTIHEQTVRRTVAATTRAREEVKELLALLA